MGDLQKDLIDYEAKQKFLDDQKQYQELVLAEQQLLEEKIAKQKQNQLIADQNNKNSSSKNGAENDDVNKENVNKKEDIHSKSLPHDNNLNTGDMITIKDQRDSSLEIIDSSIEMKDEKLEEDTDLTENAQNSIPNMSSVMQQIEMLRRQQTEKQELEEAMKESIKQAKLSSEIPESNIKDASPLAKDEPLSIPLDE